MKTLKPRPKWTHLNAFPKDVDRIVSVMKNKGYEVSREDATLIWEDFSEGWACGWMILPHEDDELVENILSASVEV